MSVADTVTPITPFTVLKWFSYGDRDNFITDRSVPVENARLPTAYKKGHCRGGPFYIYEDSYLGKQSFLGQSMITNSTMMMRADKWEYIVWEFEDKNLSPIYFERSGSI